MRISDWSSDVCSSDLMGHGGRLAGDEVQAGLGQRLGAGFGDPAGAAEGHRDPGPGIEQDHVAEHHHAGLEGHRIAVKIGRASCRERGCNKCRSWWSPYHSKKKNKKMTIR